MPERNRFRPSVMSPQVLALRHHLPRNVRRRFRDHSILARATTRIGAVALRSTSVVQIGHARTSDPYDVCPAPQLVPSRTSRAHQGPSACAGMLVVSDAAASAAVARMIVRIEVSCAKRIIRQTYCNGLASDVIANTPVQAIRGDADRWSGPKKNEQGRGPAPETYMDEAKFLFSSETAARLCADLSSQDLDRVADGAGDCLALRPHAIQR